MAFQQLSPLVPTDHWSTPREPTVEDVITFMDGLSLMPECTSDELEQNVMYNFYHSEMMVLVVQFLFIIVNE